MAVEKTQNIKTILNGIEGLPKQLEQLKKVVNKNVESTFSIENLSPYNQAILRALEDMPKGTLLLKTRPGDKDSLPNGKFPKGAFAAVSYGDGTKYAHELTQLDVAYEAFTHYRQNGGTEIIIDVDDPKPAIVEMEKQISSSDISTLLRRSLDGVPVTRKDFKEASQDYSAEYSSPSRDAKNLSPFR